VNPPLRLIVEPAPLDGALNMAIDEALLETAIDHKQPTLRIYEWSAPTVSLGYFQPADDPILEQRFAGLARVRRLSGGGALLHHHEVTYSVAFPAEHAYGENPTQLYDTAHQAIIRYLNSGGANTALRGTALVEEPFLCFGRGDARDIVIGAHKIVGSAQRRRRGAVLQHGALLLQHSPYAAEFPGLFDLTPGLRWNHEQIQQELGQQLASALAPNFEPGSLSAAEYERAEVLKQQRYSTLQNETRRMPGKNRPAQ
jgi:lipoate-protein ligase A